MYFNKIRRIGQVLHYGWQHAKQISEERYANTRRVAIFWDILTCNIKYNMWSNQYLQERMYELSEEERKRKGNIYAEKNAKREQWLKQFVANRRFLIKYTRFEYEASLAKRNERSRAYREFYHAGKGFGVESGVLITNHHYLTGKLTIMDNVMLARDSDIDTTGDLTIGVGVSIAEGAKILTHTHDLRRKMQKGGARYDELDIYHATITTPLLIDDFVWIGTRAVIMPGTSEIGRGAVISANSVVSQKIPPYAIVQGNPAKIVGFRFSPKVAALKEQDIYPPEQCIPIDVLQANFEKYFQNK